MATGSRSVLGSSDEVSDLECGLCIKDGKHKEAKYICSNCDSYICASSRNVHNRFPDLRKHNNISSIIIDNDCGLCHTEIGKKEAKHFCKNCNSLIFDSCKESHQTVLELRRQTVISSDEIATVVQEPCDVSDQLSCLSPNSGNISPESKYVSSNPSKSEDGASSKGGSIRPNGATVDNPCTNSSDAYIGSADSGPFGKANVMLLENKVHTFYKVNIKVSSDKKPPQVTGCCFMTGGELVLCDYENNKIKLLDSSLSVKDSFELPGTPWDVAALDISHVVVTIPYSQQLQLIQVAPSLKNVRTISVGKICWGVDVAVGRIFVSCFTYEKRDGEVRVYDLSGNLKKRHGICKRGIYMFDYPDYVAVSRSGDKIFVLDWGTKTISCWRADGNIVYQYSDEELRFPCGLYVDESDNVIVCDYASHNVQVITATGDKHRTLLSSKDGIKDLMCISFRPRDGTLAIGDNSNLLFVYKL